MALFKNLKKLVYTITTDTDGVTKGAKKTKQEFEGLNKKAKKSIKDIQINYAKLGIAIVAASASIVVALRKVVKEFAAFDQAMTNMASVSNASISEVTMLSKKAIEVGKKYDTSIKGVAKAYYDLSSAGQSAKEQLSSIVTVMKLAAATQEDA